MTYIVIIANNTINDTGSLSVEINHGKNTPDNIKTIVITTKTASNFVFICLIITFASYVN